MTVRRRYFLRAHVQPGTGASAPVPNYDRTGSAADSETSPMKSILQRLISHDCGQDLIEYALLCGLVGIVGILAWTNVGAAIKTTYTTWDTDVQCLSATTPNPGQTISCP
jgi:Flp pilus assembly pilin Flp